MRIVYEKKSEDFYYRNDNDRKIPLYCGAHLHYHVEIVYLKKGYSRVHIDSDVFEMYGGDLLMVFPNRIHRFEDLGQNNEYELFIVNPDIAPELSQRISTENPQDPIIHDAARNKRLVALVDILSDVKNFPQKTRGQLLKGYIHSLFVETLEMMVLKTIKPDENQALRMVVQYCSQNFTKDISLSTLENKLHLSKYYISHLFGDKLGIRFNDYVNSLRISEACRLLRMTTLSITEISDAAGFGTLRTFNRAFMKQIGSSPSEYRKSNHGEVTDISIPVGVKGLSTLESSKLILEDKVFVKVHDETV